MHLRRSWTAIVVSLLCPALLAQKAPDTRLNSSGLSFLPDLEASGSAVYATWLDAVDVCPAGSSDSGAVGIWFNRSLDGGATWLASERQLDSSSGGLPGVPAIAASESNVYVTWPDAIFDCGGMGYTGYADSGIVDSDILFNRSFDGGATWMPYPTQLNLACPSCSSLAGSSVIAAAGSSVYVTWTDDKGVYFNGSLDGGATFLPNEVRLDRSGSAFSPQVAASGSSVYVAWVDDRDCSTTISASIYLNRSLDGGTTWLPLDVRVNALACAGFEPPRIAASGASVFVTWRGFGGDLWFNRSLDGGITWQATDTPLNVGGEATGVPDIVTLGPGVFVTWTDDRNGSTDIYFNRSLDAGATWLPAEVRLDVGSPPGAADSSSPGIAGEGLSIQVVWEDERNGRSDIYVNRSLDGGTSWLSSDVRLDVGGPPGASGSFAPQIAASGSSAYVIWTDDRNHSVNSSDIYFNLALGYLLYGQGTPGSGGLVPAIAGSGEASIGGTASIEVSNGLGRARGVLAVGSNGPAAIPLDAGLLLLQPTAHSKSFRLDGSPGVPGVGSSSVNLEIPSDPSLIGTRVNFQAAIFDPGALGRAALTRGLELWIL